MARATLPLLAWGLAAALAPAGGLSAHAGAWTRAEGTGQLIITSGRRVAPIGAFVSMLPQKDATFTSIYVDYGLFDGLTIGATAYMEVSLSSPRDSSASLGGFVRKRLWQTDTGHVASVEVAYTHPMESFLEDSLGSETEKGAQEASIRALYGKGFWGDWGTAFAGAELGYSWRSGDEADEIRGAAQTGIAPWKCCMAILSAFGTVPIGSGGDAEASLKLSPSLAYTIYPDWSENEKKPRGRLKPPTIQIGVTYDLLNRDEGLGVQVGVWRRF